MAVPQFNNPMTTPNNPPLPQMSAPSTFGVPAQEIGNLSKAAAEGSANVEQYVLQNQQRTNAMAVTDAFQKWSDDMDKMQQHVLSLREQAAINSTETANQLIAGINKHYVDNLQNPAQKLAFTQMIDPSLRSYKTGIVRHEIDETNKWYQTNSNAAGQKFADTVGANPLDAGIYAVGLTNYRSILDLNGNSVKEIGQDAYDQKIRMAESLAVTNGVGSLLAGSNPDYQNARAFLESHKPGIDPLIYNKLDKDILSGEVKADGYSYEQGIRTNAALRNERGLLDPAKLDAEAVRAATVTTTRNVSQITPNQIMQQVSSQMHSPYQMGGNDCSALTQSYAAQNGVTIPRTADDQWVTLKNQGQTFTDPSLAHPGDLVFFRNTYDPAKYGQSPAQDGVTHVGVYVGDGMMVQAGTDHAIPVSSFSDIAGYGHILTGKPETTTTVNQDKLAIYRRINQEQEAQAQKEYGIKCADWGDAAAKFALNNPNASPDDVKNYVASLGAPPTETEHLTSSILSDLGIRKNFDAQKEQGALQEVSAMIQSGVITKPGQIDSLYGSDLSKETRDRIKRQLALTAAQNRLPNGLTASKIEESILKGAEDAGFKPSDDNSGYYTGMSAAREKVIGMVNDAVKNGVQFDEYTVRGWAREQLTKTWIDAAGKEDYLYKVPAGSVWVPGKGYGKLIGG